MLCVSISYHGFFHTHPNDINVAKQGEKRVLPLAFLLLTPTQKNKKPGAFGSQSQGDFIIFATIGLVHILLHVAHKLLDIHLRSRRSSSTVAGDRGIRR